MNSTILPSRSSNPRHGAGGFTLLEVLVALAIVSISLAALFTALTQGTRLSARVEERMVGSWVASNHMTEFRTREQWPEPGDEELSISMADREWHVLRVTSETADEFIRRVDITVSLDRRGDNRVATLHGYLFRPGTRIREGGQDIPFTQ